MRFDSLHFALLAVVVLLAVYGFGSGVFREGLSADVEKCVKVSLNNDCIKCRGTCGYKYLYNYWGGSPACVDGSYDTTEKDGGPCQQCREVCGATKGAGHYGGG
jgi:hypothetical protein